MNKFFQSIKKDFVLLIIIASAFAVGCYFYPGLPERVPSHWNFSGEIDGYSSRFWGAFGLPLLLIGCYLLFQIMPLIDPKRENYQKFTKAFNMFKYAFTLVLYGVYLVVIFAAKGYMVDVGLVIPLGISVLFIIIGNYITTVRHNYLFGIRTPWTLANEEVWQKTHRITGRLWVLGGILSIIALVLNVKIGGIVFLVLIIGTAIFSFAYSWWCFNRLLKG